MCNAMSAKNKYLKLILANIKNQVLFIIHENAKLVKFQFSVFFEDSNYIPNIYMTYMD